MPERRIHSGSVPKKPGRIQTPPPPAGDVVFSFRHLDSGTPEFSPAGCTAEWYAALMERMRDVSTMRHQELLSSRSPALRAHPIAWEDTSKPEGFTHLNQQLRTAEPYQFQVSKQNGRVHGFFIDVVFHVVWLDPHHRLYP